MAEPKTKSYTNYTVGKWEYTYELYDEKGWVEGSPVDKGWTPRGGLALKNIRHAGHMFANDMRVIGVWVFPKDTERFKPKFLPLGPPYFIQQPLAGHSLPFSPNVSQTIDPPDNFSSFKTESALEIKWVNKDPIFEDGKGKSSKLEIIQSFIFTDYNNTPKHEPSGGLMAARIFPIIKITYGNEDDGYIDSLRIDYRFHLKLDGNLDTKPSEVYSKIIKYNSERNQLKNFPNQAGVFKDEEHVQSVIKVIRTQNRDPNAVFSATEKPLPIEIGSIGLLNGTNIINDHMTGWDNIHWWGYRGKGKPIISAPGGFHAAHLHWRWGFLEQKIAREPQFTSGVPEEVRNYDPKKLLIGGPLVCPTNWIQDVRFAVVKNIESRQPNETNSNLRELSVENFYELFQVSNNPLPDIIENGEDLVMWYSIESKKSTFIEKTSKDSNGKTILSRKRIPAQISGTYFIQGIFFAHEPEPVYSIKNPMVGSAEPLYEPDSKEKILKERKWYR